MAGAATARSCNVTAFDSADHGLHVPVRHQCGLGGAPVSIASRRFRLGARSTYPPNTNSYRGSIGTTTSVWGWTTGYMQCQPDPMNLIGGGNPCVAFSTGLFVYYISNGIQNVTDGTSNTIAFSESLVGDNGTYPVLSPE